MPIYQFFRVYGLFWDFFCASQVISRLVQYDPEDLSRVYVKDLNFPEPVMVYPVQAVDNSKIPRKQNVRQQIDFAKLYGGER